MLRGSIAALRGFLAFSLGAMGPSLGAATANAPAEGWSYSRAPGEGDRAATGCTRETTVTSFACLVVRCEDDFSIGFYAHTSRKAGDLGAWHITVDRDSRRFVGSPTEAPYGARLAGDTAWLFESIKQGAVAYLHPLAGEPLASEFLTLSGSLVEVNRALAFCAPRKPPLTTRPESPRSPG